MSQWGRPIAVLKYRARFVGLENDMYELCTRPTMICQSITKDQAKKVIKKYGLELALKNKYGEVYDTPGRTFQKLWKGKFED